MAPENLMKRAFRRRAGLVLLSAGWLVSVAALVVSLTEPVSAACDADCLSLKPANWRVIFAVNNQPKYWRISPPSGCELDECARRFMCDQGFLACMQFGTDETNSCQFDAQEVTPGNDICERDGGVPGVAEPSAEEEDEASTGFLDCWGGCNPEM